MMRRKPRRSTDAGLALLLLGLSAPVRADAEQPGAQQQEAGEPSGFWSLFRSQNDDVNDGNAQLAKQDPKGALAAYDKAAQSLPSNRGVYLNRGLALMASGELEPARESLLQATQPPAAPSVRAKAYYNLGNAFYKEADALAAEQNHEQAQQRFREAVDAFKQSLRLSPSDVSAAWNLELASRRLSEEQQKQEEQDQQNQDQDKQDQQNQDQDQDKQDQQNQDQDQDKDKQDQQNQDQDKQDQQQPKPDDSQQDQAQPPPQPSDVQRALDALQDGEENLERHRAQQRALRERRQPEKDW